MLRARERESEGEKMRSNVTKHGSIQKMENIKCMQLKWDQIWMFNHIAYKHFHIANGI